MERRGRREFSGFGTGASSLLRCEALVYVQHCCSTRLLAVTYPGILPGHSGL